MKFTAKTGTLAKSDARLKLASSFLPKLFLKYLFMKSQLVLARINASK